MKALTLLLVIALLVAGVAAVGFTSASTLLNPTHPSGSAISTDTAAPIFVACEADGCPCPGC